MDFNVLIGKVLKEVKVSEGKGVITFVTEDGEVYQQFHSQDCCEEVKVEDICGNLEDLLGSPIIQAEESTLKDKNPEGIETVNEYPESFTWTFYKLATEKGFVTIRWWGGSNGYYSEEVSFGKKEGGEEGGEE